MIDIDLINDKAWEYRGHLIDMYDKGYDDGVEAGERDRFLSKGIEEADKFYKQRIDAIREEVLHQCCLEESAVGTDVESKKLHKIRYEAFKEVLKIIDLCIM